MHSLYTNYMKTAGRVVLILICLFFSYQLLFTPSHWIFVDYFNLLIHEAGHLLFFFFGQFIDILAGSALQIIMPCVFLGYFLRRGEYFNSSVMFFWIGNNVVNVSIYMKDAQAMVLPLLGGDNVIHDWNYLFSSMGLLPFSEVIGCFFYILGTLFLIASFSGMLFFTVSDIKK